jgi:hypothetical protein
MTAAADKEPVPPPDRAWAETYLRLRAEAELRRVQALPRPDPLAEMGVPAPLRGAARAALPLGRRAATTMQPLAENAAQTLRPLAGSAAQALGPLANSAAQTLRPLADGAARSLQPLADNASRTLQPLAGRLIGTALPAAEQAARRLHPLAWQAIGRVRELQGSAAGRLTLWRSQAGDMTAPLRGSPAHDPPRREEPTAEEGARRLGAVAHALSWVGALDEATADSVVESLETALVLRSRMGSHRYWFRIRHAMRRHAPVAAPAGAYLAAPVGTLVRTAPESGLGDVYLITLVIAPDRAVLTVAGRVTESEDRSLHRDPWPLFGPTGRPSAADDRGNSYQLHEDSGWSDGEGDWGGTLRIAPIPPAGTSWLELTMSPGSAPVRVDLAGPGGDPAAGPEPAGSPAERLIDVAAMNLLDDAIGAGTGRPSGHDLSQAADIVSALDAVGALTPARDAVGSLVTLAGRLGVDVPPALSAAGPPRDLPPAWASVLDSSRCQDGPHGVAPVAVVLPELDGTRFVLAGLRSDPAGAELHVLAWGDHGMPGFFERSRVRWTWSARDDRGRWHILTEGGGGASDLHADLKLTLKPPLHPDATSLEVHVAGRSGGVTATVPLDWREPL